MAWMEYTIAPGTSLTRWQISPLMQRPYDSEPDVFDGDMNVTEGYVQIVYPVRRAFLQEDCIQGAGYDEGAVTELYFPFEDVRVDHSCFMNEPHHLWIYAKTFLDAPENGEYTFELMTPGGVKIWVNGEFYTLFAPYTRNVITRTEIALPLKEGSNEIWVYADDLAERDISFFFELRYKGDVPLVSRVEVEEAPEQIENVEAFLKSCWFERDVFEGDTLHLRFAGDILEQPLSLGFLTYHNASLGGLETPEPERFEVLPGMEALTLPAPEGMTADVVPVAVTGDVGRYRLHREMTVGVHQPEAIYEGRQAEIPKFPSEGLRARKRIALEYISGHSDPVVNHVIARLAAGGEFDEEVASWLEVSLAMIENHADCADFYLPVLLVLTQRYADRLPGWVFERAKAAALRFRYWIDEPGNDVMWYFSENHALLFHISQYLAGHIWPGEQFTASGRSGKAQYELGRARLIEWFERFLACGYGEWNSATYMPIDLIGFFCIDLIGPDEDLIGLARRALDLTFKVIGYNTFNGVMTGTFGRSYEETLKGYSLSEINFLSLITTGVGSVARSNRAATLYCISDYEPPQYLKDVSVGKNQWAAVEWDQGEQRVKTYSFRTSEAIMGCARRYRPFEHGHQQHIMHVALGERAAPFFINHPGEPLYSGKNRPSYWAGNGTLPFIEQYKDLMVLLFDTDPDELVPYIHAYTPLYLYDGYKVEENWFFARAGEGYVAAWFANGVSLTESGANTGKELVSPGRRNAALVRCGSLMQHGSFEAFQRIVKAGCPEWDGEKSLGYTDPAYGRLEVKRAGEVTLGGGPLGYVAAPEAVIEKGWFC